jgi:hypothetical protein
LTALCQSKPTIIDPSDCRIQLPTLVDFPLDPASQRKGQIFCHWVRLCSIIGDIAKTLSRTADSSPSSLSQFPHELRQRLIDWAHSLPAELQLPIRSAYTITFDKDVHQLYLPYLTTIIVLHLKRSAHALPQALPPAILAASCIVRILKDILSRGNTRFLMAISCWYAGTAFIALLQACRIEHLSKDAHEGLDILVRAMDQLQQMWATANVIRQGFNRLRQAAQAHNKPLSRPEPAKAAPGPGILDHPGVHLPPAMSNTLEPQEDFDWTELFPFVTRDTNSIADCLLGDREQGTATRGFPSPENMLFQDTLMTQYHELLDPLNDYSMSFPDMDIVP